MATSVAFIYLFLIDACIYDANYACCTVSELCYSILTVLINKKYGMFLHFVLGSFSLGDRSQIIREASCRRQAGPGVAPIQTQMLRGCFHLTPRFFEKLVALENVIFNLRY